MHEMRHNSDNACIANSMPQRELQEFIKSVSTLVGVENQGALTELWLDELACMDRTPEPSSPDWRLVTIGASARLARQLIDRQLRELSL